MSEQKKPLVYLREGHVCAFTVPLPAAVMDRWKRGHLQRVTEDGRTWPGDPFVMPGDEPEPEPEGDGESGEVKPPKRTASKAEWAAYAVKLGAVAEDKAGTLTRDQLIELCTAPEDKGDADS